ncbi:MAG: hypothetical protein ACKV0T_12320, partial [Planctomycetales bacterium]
MICIPRAGSMALVALLLTTAVFTGCSGSITPNPPPTGSGSSSATTDEGAEGGAAETSGDPAGANGGTAATAEQPAAKPARTPFDPPPLADLESRVEWEAQPVVDPVKMLRDEQAQESAPASVAEALALRNTSKKENETISRVLGRLPDDTGVIDYDATINRHIRRDVKSTNPIMMNAIEEFDIAELQGCRLFGFDRKLRGLALADAVVSWHTSQDRLY